MNIINLYEKYFDEETKEIFETLSNSDYKLYLVGGLVRDLLLNRKSLDIDITVEGNAIEFAKTINCKILSTHEDFGTVKVEINGKHIDFASTRTEFYPKAGHLPQVEKISTPLKDDILRRDFTVNSLAMSLNKETFCDVIDYVGGLKDLENKTLKVLHDNSFIDDPSRILRGLKYASRLDFTLDKETKILQDKYLSDINYDMSYSRILNEFFRIEWTPKTFETLIEQGIYKLINPDIKKDFDFWFTPSENIVYLGLLMPDERFELTKQERQIIDDVKKYCNTTPETDFETYKTFSSMSDESVQIISIMKNTSAKHYLQNLKNIKIETTGQDLINMGLKPSKEFKKILDFLIEEKLKKPYLTKTDELELVRTFF